MRKTKWCQERICVLIALVLLAGIPFLPAAASPAQATFYSNAHDGGLVMNDGNYSDVHGASLGTVSDTGTALGAGQIRLAMIYLYLFRGALFFDTSSLPYDATISSAVLSLYGFYDNSDVDFLLTVVDGSGLNEPLQGVDYGYLGSQNVSGGSFDTSGFSTGGYNDIPLNETGIGWISKTGITKLGLRSSRDIAATEPGISDEHLGVYASEQGLGYQPKLVVTYTTLAVGGEAYPVSKVSLLAPWIAVGIVLAGSLIRYVLRRRMAQS